MELKLARRIAKLTQAELAKAAHVDDSLISMLESGRRDIESVSYKTAFLLARALNVRVDELFPIADDGSESGEQELSTPAQ